MAGYLEFVDHEEILKVEERYNAEEKEGEVTEKTQLKYACFLVRSRYKDDIRKGIEQFNELCTKRHCDQSEFLFYLALAYYKLGEYGNASKFIKRLVSCEPQNTQAKELEELIDSKTTQDGLLGIGVVGGLAVLGGALLSMIFAKKSS